MHKFSVKKPLTIFVAVIAVLVLGVVAYFKMTPDLLPNMDFPYVMIMTTYPGASPEKVEAEISRPMEQSMSTLEHIKTVTSTSAENYSTVLLEFEESVNMDTIGVDIQQNIATLSANWEDTVGTPYVLKINPSMLPVEVAAVAMEGMTTVELTDFINTTLMNKLEGIPGVARISTTGMVEQQLHVILDASMIDAVNQKIRDVINGEVDAAVEELEAQRDQLQSAQNQIYQAQRDLNQSRQDLMEQADSAGTEMEAQLTAARDELQASLNNIRDLRDKLRSLENRIAQADVDIAALENLQSWAVELEATETAYEAQFDSIRNSGASPEDMAAQLEELENSPGYQQFQADKLSLTVSLATYGLSDTSQIPGKILQLETQKTLDQAELETIRSALAQQDIDPDDIDSAIAEMEEMIVQLDNGIVSVDDVTQMMKQTGLQTINSASQMLAQTGATLSSTMDQVNAGFDTIEQSRESALAQADLHNIITMDLVSQILMAQNFAMPAGYVAQDGISYMVSVGDEITDVETLENLLLFDMKMEGVEPIYLKDVAVVALTDNQNETYAKLGGENGIMLSFEKQSTYATAETTNNINSRFRELEAEYPGLKFVALMNQGDYIYLIVDTILNSLLLGAVFAVIVLFLFLKDLRPTFITLCAIPISVIFAIVLMYFSGVTINMISLSGLAVAVGMLVDNSVVVIENIYRLRDKGANVIQAAVSGAAQVAGAVTASTLTTVCVFLPIVFVEGITKQLFTDLALTMTYALMASLIVSLTLVPAMASGMLRKEKHTQNKTLDKALSYYEKAANWSLDHKAVVLLASLALLVVTGLASVSKGFIFMPEMDMPSLNVTVTMPEGSTMEEAADLADQVMTHVLSLEEVDTAGAMMEAGTSSAGGVSRVDYSLTVYVNLKDQSASGSAVGRKIEDLCADLPCEVSASSAMLDMSALSGSGISMNIYAEDMQTLQNAARTAAEALGQLEGVASVSDGLEDAAPALHIDIDRNAAMERGMTVAQIYMQIASALTNTTTTASMELEGNTTSVIIEKPLDSRLDVDALKAFRLEVEGQDGAASSFLLSDVARVEETSSLSTIQRAGQRRYLSVTAQLEPDYNVTLLTSQAEEAIARLDLGEGVSYVFTGENETIMEAVEQLLLMLLLGVLLVYLVMVAQFQSLLSPFIVMFTIPLAFTGGFLALLLCGMEISVVSLIGFVMLVGIIVNNGIVLVDYINQLRLEGSERRKAIVEAGITRMRPILMTTITTILGLIDMAVNASAGTALMRPVAVVCIGGLLYATLMTLFVIPCIYDLLSRRELRNVREEDLRVLDL